jgi:hypothetical protein
MAFAGLIERWSQPQCRSDGAGIPETGRNIDRAGEGVIGPAILLDNGL